MADSPHGTTGSPVTPQARRGLVALLRAAYPHATFPDGPYERTAEEILRQVDESLWHRLTLATGLESLDAAAGGDFAALDPETAYHLLVTIEDAEFFRFVRSVAVVTFYDDEEVHRLLGYEGPSYDKGGYLHRGFDDLDWLPSPRIEEYDGPDRLVEVAPDDEPVARA